MPLPIRVIGVDSDGIRLRGLGDRAVDVLFDGRRVWSFWLRRDTEAAGQLGLTRTVAWPRPMQRFLDGATRVVVREHVGERVLFDAERSFGDSQARIEVVNRLGAPMGLDKSGRLTATFEGRSEEQVAPLLDAIEKVIHALDVAGVDAFPGYGTLLGAVREQRLLGHDSDADLCYVSRHRRPVDVVRESFGLQRALERGGFATRRYSGGAFKVEVIESDGVRRGLDVFGGFFDDPPGASKRLYLMGEVGVEFEEAWVFPLGTCTLEGRTLPAPAQPGRLLEAMYGPSWRVPDPAFQFETPESVVRRMDGWFRGTRPNRSFWDRRFSVTRARLPRGLGGSRLVHVMVDREGGVPAQVIDLGCGQGADALWLARQGAGVTGYDFAPRGAEAVLEAAAGEGLDLGVRPLNLNEWRGVFAEGARLARTPGPRVVLARHVADALTPFGRDSLVRLASMALRDGGRLYLETWTGAGQAPAPRLRPLPTDRLLRLLERHGARTVSAEEIPAARKGWPRGEVARVVVEWS